MNEIAKIHLGRQAFVIAVDAHKELQAYLRAIKTHLGGSDEAAEEVELRIAELLTERGVGGDKVVLAKDVAYIKTQLGEPGDFSEDTDEQGAGELQKEIGPKRLFREPQRGLIAGVAAGLANYLNVDAVFVRLGFVVLTLLWGWGAVLYLVLWLITPELKTKSDRLRAEGKPVTVDTLKQLAERADVPGATHRLAKTMRSVLGACFKLFMAVCGLALILAAISVVFAAVTTGAYMWLHDGRLMQENFFPVGGSEVLLVILALVASVIVATLCILLGVAMLRRKWQVPGWGLASLIGLFLVSMALGAALTADAAPKVRDRYEVAHRITNRPLQAFTEVSAIGDDVRLRYEPGTTYSLEFRYIGKPDLSEIKTEIKDGKLLINAQDFANDRNCTMLCLYHNYDMQVTVHAPGWIVMPYSSVENLDKVDRYIKNMHILTPPTPLPPSDN